ncbi:MAG: right-handed parallel beta-helix repeat-containing protein, partial [Abditibacteriaceae bacterium]
MKASRRTFIKQGALATIATFGAGSLLWSNMDSVMAQDAKARALPISAEVAAAKAANAINEVPYISTYYNQPTVDAGKPVTINYYVTDFDQKEYMKDDHSETFTVEYWINGVKSTLQNVKAGDNSVTLKSIPKGEVLFAFQATDQQGRTSHRLFLKFTVIDPASRTIPEDKILKPDLKKFGIYDDDTHPVETTKGLNEMLKWAHDNGYRKVILPKGTYRFDENSTVQMVTQLTLDMNGSTFKLNPNALESGMMLEMFHCTDSHVINGTFQGDLKEHVFTKRGADYWVSALNMGQDTIDCSFEDLKLVDITGAAVTTSIGGNQTRTYSEVTNGVGAFTLGDVDAQGKPIDSKIRATSKLVDISKFVASKNGFLQMGHYLGYQGNGTGTWVYKASFYDKDKNYISAIPGFLYRRLYPPTNANYARFTLYSAASRYCGVKPEGQLTLFEFRPPYNCTFKNLDIESARACGMAPSGFNNLLVEGCTFTNSGSAASTCALDAEDGWDGSQDLYFRNNVFNKNPRNEFLTDAGHNFVMTGNTMAVVIRARTESYVFRNNTIKGGTFEYGARDHTNFPRVYNNTFIGP